MALGENVGHGGGMFYSGFVRVLLRPFGEDVTKAPGETTCDELLCQPESSAAGICLQGDNHITAADD